MAYAFEITAVERLPRAGVGVLDGKLLHGAITTGSQAELVHGQQRLPVTVDGVVLGVPPVSTDLLSLTVDLRSPAMQLAKAGDLLVSK